SRSLFAHCLAWRAAVKSLPILLIPSDFQMHAGTGVAHAISGDPQFRTIARAHLGRHRRRLADRSFAGFALLIKDAQQIARLEERALMLGEKIPPQQMSELGIRWHGQSGDENRE